MKIFENSLGDNSQNEPQNRQEGTKVNEGKGLRDNIGEGKKALSEG